MVAERWLLVGVGGLSCREAKAPFRESLMNFRTVCALLRESKVRQGPSKVPTKVGSIYTCRDAI
jgi:hypothetical protein